MSTPRFLADEDMRFDIISAVRRIEPTIEIQTILEIGKSGMPDGDVLELAHSSDLLLLSHDVNTLKAEAENRIGDGRGIKGVFMIPQSRPTRIIVESIIMIWAATAHEEWANRIVYLPL